MKLWSWYRIFSLLLIAVGLGVSLFLFQLYLRTREHAPPQPVDNTLYLRFGHNFQVNSALHLAAEKFAKMVRIESNGRTHVTVYPAQQLGSDDQMIEMVRDGTLDIMLVPTAKLGTAVPAMQYVDLPFFFRNRNEVYRMLDGEPGRLILAKLNSIDLIGVTFWEMGFKQFTANRPIHEPEDFRDLKMRVMKNRVIMDQYKAFGAQSLPIDFHSTYQALQDGVVDGQENPLIAIAAMDFHKVQAHLTLSNHGYLGYVFVISQKVFDTLPNDIGLLLIDIARRLTPFERAETLRYEAESLDIIRRTGITIYELTEEQRRHFSALTAHIPYQFEGVIGSDIMSRSEELLREQREENLSDIVIGLDTDLSIDSVGAGLAIKRGAMLAINEINEHGGVLGRRLALIAKDDRGLPERGIRNIDDFVAFPNLVAIIGGSTSNVVLREIDATHQARVPMLIPRAAATRIIDNGYYPNFIFRLSVSDSDSGTFLINHSLEHAQRPALLLNNAELGRENYQVLTEALQRRGIAPVAVEWFDSGEYDFPVHLSRIEASGADIVVVVATTAESIRIVNAMAERLHPLPMISHWGMSNSNMRDEARSALNKVDLTFIQSFSFLTAQTPKSLDVTQRYLATFDASSARDIFVPDSTAHAYDLVHLLALAITAAGTTDREAVRDALEHLDTHEGLIKTYHQPFTPKQHEALSTDDYHFSRYDANGVIVSVLPTTTVPQ
ncbi:TRAP-type transport system periplasmic protein [Gammaproteobacteria bacterium]